MCRPAHRPRGPCCLSSSSLDGSCHCGATDELSAAAATQTSKNHPIQSSRALRLPSGRLGLVLLLLPVGAVAAGYTCPCARTCLEPKLHHPVRPHRNSPASSPHLPLLPHRRLGHAVYITTTLLVSLCRRPLLDRCWPAPQGTPSPLGSTVSIRAPSISPGSLPHARSGGVWKGISTSLVVLCRRR
jgi:hypothetical protein